MNRMIMQKIRKFYEESINVVSKRYFSFLSVLWTVWPYFWNVPSKWGTKKVFCESFPNFFYIFPKISENSSEIFLQFYVKIF